MLLILLLGAWHILSFGFCLQDDAFIGLRYSHNLAEGNGPVFNPGERVEGYTNFIWILLGSIPFILGIDPVLFIRALGVITAVLAALAVGQLAKVLSGNARFAGHAAAFIFVCLPFAMGEAAMGLETLLFSFFVAGAFWRYLIEVRDQKTRGIESGFFLASAYLTRPEGLAVGLFLLMIDTIRWIRTSRKDLLKTQLRTRWLVFGSIVVSHILFRAIYYGDYVPNTFRAKVSGGGSLGRGLNYLHTFVKDSFSLVITSFLSVILLLRSGSSLGKRIAAAFLLFIAAYVLYVVYVGGDFKPTHRFFVLPASLLTAMAGAGLAVLIKKHRAPVSRAFVLLILLSISVQLITSGGSVREFALWRSGVLPVHIAAGQWMGENFPDSTLIATGNAGVIPFYSNLACIDMHGLCDKTIASRPVANMGRGLPGHEKGDGLYVLSRHPDIILFMQSRFSAHPLTEEEVSSRLFGISELELWGNPRFHEDYQLESVDLNLFVFNYYKLQ